MAQAPFQIRPIGVAPRTVATLASSLEQLRDSETGDGTPRWCAGVQFQQLGCDPLQRIENFLCAPDTSTPDYREPKDWITFDAFTVRELALNSPTCSDWSRVDGDNLARWDAMVSEQIGAELMAGGARSFDGAAPDTNPSLASAAAVVVDGPFNPLNALAVLEQAAADTLHGARAIFHVTPRGFTLLADDLMVSGGRAHTKLGNLVIADAGYAGTTPAANGGGGPGTVAAEWWYTSGDIGWKLTAPQMVGEPWQRVDRTTNQIESLYEGHAIVAFDPCAVVAVPVCYDSACADGVT